PTSFTESFAPGNTATASTDATSIFTSATNTVGAIGTSMHAQAERSGIITTLDGNLHITVPYTFTFTATNGQSCCSFLDGQVFLEIFGPGSNGELGQDAKDVFHSEFAPQSFSQSGAVDWNLTGLTPGTYEIDVGAASSSTFVPEPGTLLLLGIGTVGLG